MLNLVPQGRNPALWTTVKSWVGWIGGLFRSLWHLLVPGAQGSSDVSDHLLDARRIIFVMQPIIVLGLIAVGIDCGKLAARGFILAVACLAAGFLAGFLFGIPRVLQGDRTLPNPASGGTAYRQRVNTNLEEISDWLTKIIVGLGLYELKRIPAWVGELARVFASSFQRPDQEEGVFGAAIVFFLVCGFLLGYLVTRLYLQGALGRADIAAVPDLGGAPKRQQSESMDSSVDDEPENGENK
jgi:hypothetical protein